MVIEGVDASAESRALNKPPKTKCCKSVSDPDLARFRTDACCLDSRPDAPAHINPPYSLELLQRRFAMPMRGSLDVVARRVETHRSHRVGGLGELSPPGHVSAVHLEFASLTSALALIPDGDVTRAEVTIDGASAESLELLIPDPREHRLAKKRFDSTYL